MDLGDLDNLNCHLRKYSRIQTASRSEALPRHTQLLLMELLAFVDTASPPVTMQPVCPHFRNRLHRKAAPR